MKNIISALGISLSICTAVSFMNVNPVLASEAPVVKTIVVSDITYSGNIKMSNEQIGWLLPELKKGTIDVATLSRQIQFANDSGAVNLAVNFNMDKMGHATAVVTSKEKATDYTFLSMDNTGNKQTGDYRSTLTYINTNTSKKADTIGLSYVTSPDHINDVSQAAVFYRMLLPKLGDSLYLTYTYSDVDMGRIAQVGTFGIDATGKGTSYGLHYQKNLDYKPTHRSSVDFGVDNSKYDNDTSVSSGGSYIGKIGTGKVDTTMLTLSYSDTTRSQNNAFTYNVGYSRNVGGNTADYDRLAVDKNFGIVRYGLNYQHKYQSDWITSLKVNGQYTSNNMISQAKLGEGGLNTVRGFAEQVVQGDQGITSNLEFYSPEIAKGQRLVVFVDYAQLSNNRPSTGELTSGSLASVGLGWRYGDENGWNGRLDYGFVVEGKEYNLNQDKGRLHIAVSKKL